MPATSKFCRACLSSRKRFTYFLFKNVSPEEYHRCTSVQIYKDDGLPKCLCKKCYSILMKIIKFKRMCVESQDKLMVMKTSSLLLHIKLSKKPEKEFKHAIDGYDSEVDPNDHSGVDFSSQEVNILKNESLMNEVINKAEAIYDHAIEKYDHEGLSLMKKENQVNEVIQTDTKEDTNVNPKLEKNIKTEILGNNDVNGANTIKTKKLNRLKKGFKFKHLNATLKLKPKRNHFSFTCEVCNRKFNYIERLEAHKSEHEGKVVPIHCRNCDKTFMTWSGLKRHFEAEHTTVSLESLRCSVCGKICKSRQSLQMHYKAHDDRILWICHVCGKWCSTSYILKIHQETHKENRDKAFTCERCGKKYFTNTLLKAHVRKIHQEQRYICQICNYPFKDKYNLAQHLLIHDGKKIHKCTLCHKSFGARSSLVEHMRIHSGERPYTCGYCPKSFLSKRRLTDHHRTHTGERPFKCNICEQGFTQRGTMKRHMKIHVKLVST